MQSSHSESYQVTEAVCTKHQFVTFLAAFRCLMGHLHQTIVAIETSANPDHLNNYKYICTWHVLSKNEKCTLLDKANPPSKLCIFCYSQLISYKRVTSQSLATFLPPKFPQTPKFTPNEYFILYSTVLYTYSIVAALILFHVIRNCQSN